MGIANVVLRGFGNGSVAGTIALVVTRGYSIGNTPPPTTAGYIRATAGGSARVAGSASGSGRVTATAGGPN